MLAVLYQKVELLKLLIAAGVDLNLQDKRKATAVMHSSERGLTEITSILTAAGANLNL